VELSSQLVNFCREEAFFICLAINGMLLTSSIDGGKVRSVPVLSFKLQHNMIIPMYFNLSIH
jgi:hypothetical protein